MSYGEFMKACGRYAEERESLGLPRGDMDAESEAVRDLWIAEKRYGPLVAFILDNWDSGNVGTFADPLSDALIAAQDSKLYIRLWRGVLRAQLEKMWSYAYGYGQLHPTHTAADVANVDISNFNQYSTAESVERRLAWHWRQVLQTQEKFISGLQQLGDSPELERQNSLSAYYNRLKMPPEPKVSDKRKIDENLFWTLIEESRAENAPNGEFMERLRGKLEGFAPRQLKAFYRLLIHYMSELYSWDHWALAYIVRNGCGDDAFDDFRAWAVSKGRAGFAAIRDLELERLASLFTEDPQLEELPYLCAAIYEERSGNELLEPRGKAPKIAGVAWTEDMLPERYPELWRIFGPNS